MVQGRAIPIACMVSSQILGVPSLFILLGLVLEEGLQESFWQNQGSGKYCVDLSCIMDFVFQHD